MKIPENLSFHNLTVQILLLFIEIVRQAEDKIAGKKVPCIINSSFFFVISGLL